MFFCNTNSKNYAIEILTENLINTEVKIEYLSKSYKIISEDRNLSLGKVSIDVRLNGPISEIELEKIAYKIKKERNEFDKIWICYYLPGNKVGHGAWATTHFSPILKVNILGATKESMDKLNKVKVSGQILKIWKDYDAIMPCRIFLVNEKNQLLLKSEYAENNFTKAGQLVQKLTKRRYKNKTRYETNNKHNEYYVIEKNGNLGMYSKEDGKFKEAILEKL